MGNDRLNSTEADKSLDESTLSQASQYFQYKQDESRHARLDSDDIFDMSHDKDSGYPL